MNEPLLFAAVQLSSQEQCDKNMERVAELVAEAARRGAKAVVLPENFAYFGDDEGRRVVAEPLEDDKLGAIGARLAELTRTHRVHLLAGGMPERSADPARPYNSFAVFAPDGRLAATYRKIHLFDVDIADGARYCESSSTMPGEAPVVVEIAGIKVGLSICYDLRFPELYRALSDAGAEVIIVPAAFTLTTGKDHWHVLLRARAIESQAYVIAAAQWGKHPKGRQTYGKSCIIDPWGEIIAQASEGEGLAYAAIDTAYLQHVRKSVPSLRHRRLGQSASTE